MTLFQMLAHAQQAGGMDLLRPVPLHPILVNFTAALVPAPLLSDVLGRVLKRDTLLHAGWWTLLYAAAVTPVTALAGWLWLRDMPEMDHGEMAIHKWLGTALAVLLVAVVAWRWRLHRAGAAPEQFTSSPQVC